MKHLTRAFAAGAIALSLVSAIFVAGCTTAKPEPADAPSIPDLSASAPESPLQAKLLSQDDLPEGYEETTLPIVQGGFGSLIGCPSIEAPASSGADEARVSFAGVAGGAAAGNLISESVRMTGPTQSHQVLADLAKVPQQCPAAKPVTATTRGTETTALELNATLSGTGTVVNGYVVGMRDDHVLVLVVYLGPGKADRATVESVAQIALDKATKTSP